MPPASPPPTMLYNNLEKFKALAGINDINNPQIWDSRTLAVFMV